MHQGVSILECTEICHIASLHASPLIYVALAHKKMSGKSVGGKVGRIYDLVLVSYWRGRQVKWKLILISGVS